MERSGHRPTPLQGGGPAPGSEQVPVSLLTSLPCSGRPGRAKTSSACGAHLPVLDGPLPWAPWDPPPSIPEKLETLQQLLVSTPEKLASNQECWQLASFMGRCALVFSLEVLHGKYEPTS